MFKNTVKTALENMYMLGGMGRPLDGYDRYLTNMIATIQAAHEAEVNILKKQLTAVQENVAK